MTLAELLENQFRADTRFRGAAYLEAERIALTRVTAERVQAVVRDGVEYQTLLNRDDNQVRMHCSCDLFQRTGACKHLWGTILAVDAAGYVHGSTRHGHVPPFVVETRSLRSDDEFWDDVGEGSELTGPVTTKRTRPSRKVEVRRRPWETQLESLREQLEPVARRSTKADREREILYELDLVQSREQRQLVIQTSQRQRRASGQWGKLKPLKLRPEQLREIEHEDDRRILAYLAGGIPERSTWQAQQTEIQSAVHRYAIPYELSLLTLPWLCKTGRFQIAEVEGQKPDSNRKRELAWSDNEPWELAIEVVFNDEESHWRLKGRMHRGDESRPLSDTRLVVPGGLVLLGNTIERLCDFGAFDWVDLINHKERDFSVPEGDETDFVDRLLDMPILPRLDLPEALRLEEITCEPVPHLVMHSPRGPRWQMDKVRGDVMFEYMESMLPGASRRWAIVQREQRRCILRNRESEAEAWAHLQDIGFRRMLDRTRSDHDVDIESRRLGPAVRTLMQKGWVVRADGKMVREMTETRFRIASGVDWFELHADIDFNGQRAAFPELLSALARGDSTVRLDDGSLGILPEEWLQQFGLLSGLGTNEEEHVRFGNDQVALLDALTANIENVDYDARFLEMRERFRSFSGVSAAIDPKSFHGTLRPYQKEGLGWLEFLHEFNFGGCLADDMGLGKTVQILALMADQRHGDTAATKRKPSLVVVPKSLMFNWSQECHRFTPSLTVLEYGGPDRQAMLPEMAKHDLILTTYGTMRRDINELREHPFEYVVLDEAQTIKNPSSQVAKAARLLRADHRLALSGTPVENHLGDLWSIFEFLNPGMLGRSSAFKLFATDTDDTNARGALAQGLRPFILRRTKREVAADLPEKLEETIFCDLGTEQRKLYNELRQHYRESILGIVEEQGLAKSKMHVLEALLRLRQAACHPALLDRGRAEDSSAKLDFLCPHLEELLAEGHKALVFSQFTSMLSIVRNHLDSREITYEYLDGRTRDREAHVKRFQEDPNCGVFLISLKAGGLGLNLTAADYVFLLDPWWNPAVEAQAIDRAHRVGQSRHVFAYRMICRDTVEEKIAELQSRKRNLADAILESDNSTTLKDLSLEDLERLLS